MQMPTKKKPILGRALELIARCSSVRRKHMMVTARFNLLPLKRTSKRFRILRHNNYRFIGEYEFSPPNTPMLRCPRPPVSKKRKRLLSLFLCGGRSAAESSAEAGWGKELEVLSIGGDQSGPLDWEEEEEEDVSVDRRAERFIQRFYEEMRIQRRRSL